MYYVPERDEVIQVRVKSAAKEEMQQVADDCDLPLSVVVRMALAKGWPIARKELTPLRRPTS